MFAGAGHVLHGLQLLRQPGIRLFVAAPLAINILLFGLALAGISSVFNHLLDHYLASWPAWTHWLAWLFFGALAALVLFFGFTLLANIIASPFNGMLAEAVERRLMRPQEPLPFAWRRLVREAGRALKAEFRKLLYIGLRAVPLVVLTLIPGLNIAAPILWLLFGAWMLSIEYLDCPFGNHARLFPAAVIALRGQRRLALGFGVGMTVLTVIPVLNFLAMPAGVAGATSLYCAHFAEGADA